MNLFDSVLKALGFHEKNLHQSALEPTGPEIEPQNIVLNPSANEGTTNLSAGISFGEGSLVWQRHGVTARDQEKVIDQGTSLQHNRTTGK